MTASKMLMGVQQYELDNSHDAERKWVIAFPLDWEGNVQQKSVSPFHIWYGSDLFLAGKGDPPSRSATAKDIARERALDRSLKDPPPLPSWSVAEERRPSRVDLEVDHSPSDISICFLTFVSRCCMHPHRSMRPFWGYTFIKIIPNIVLTSNNAAR